MAKRQHSKLATALRDRLLVGFTSALEEGLVNGYVLDIGPSFFLTAIVDGGIWFDGFQCHRLSDVRGLQAPRAYAAFAEAALKKRGERMPKKPHVSVASLEQLLVSADRAFGLVTIHRQRIDPDVCNIGRVKSIRKGVVDLLRIRPDACWDDEPTEYRLRDITRVDFGGGYENALKLMGGPSPAGRKKD